MWVQLLAGIKTYAHKQAAASYLPNDGVLLPARHNALGNLTEIFGLCDDPVSLINFECFYGRGAACGGASKR